LEEASDLVHNARGKLVIAHPNDPNGTSLVKVTDDLKRQTEIIDSSLLQYIDGIECWHSRNTKETSYHYEKFAKTKGLLMTGGSDCHQNPVIMGTVNVPDFVIEQFRIKKE
jgi:predicted metal-dependent phosphoesterase TrpH